MDESTEEVLSPQSDPVEEIPAPQPDLVAEILSTQAGLTENVLSPHADPVEEILSAQAEAVAESLSAQAETVAESPALQPEPVAEAALPPKKGGRKGLIIGIAVGALALVIAAAVFLFTYFSANARFDRAMKSEAFETAEEIFRGETLKASEQNDSHYLTLADRHQALFKAGTEDYETAVRALRELEAAELYADSTREEIKTREKAVIKAYVGEIDSAFARDRLDYTAAMQALLSLKSEDLPDADTRNAVEACEETVINTHLQRICDAYKNSALSYEEAIAQIGASNPFGEAVAAELMEEALAKTDAQRDVFYNKAVRLITDDMADPEVIIAALEPFGSYRCADALCDVHREIAAGNGISAANLLLAYREETADESGDYPSGTSPSDVFGMVMQQIRAIYLRDDLASDDYGGKLDNKLHLDYVEMMFDDTEGKKTSMFGGESSQALRLAKELDMDWFSSCQGGTGKVIYLGHYLNSSWGDSYDEYYYYRYENLKDIPLEKMPSSLEEVEYLVLYEQGAKFYSTYSSSSDGSTVKVYIRTIQVKVIRFPSGEVIYDSGVLTGPTPKSTLTLFSGTQYAYGDDPDLTSVTAKVKELVGLE